MGTTLRDNSMQNTHVSRAVETDENADWPLGAMAKREDVDGEGGRRQESAVGAEGDNPMLSPGSDTTDRNSNRLFGKSKDKDDHLMFVKREEVSDERKAIFVRVSNIVFTSSGNNETIRVVKQHMSTVSTVVSRTSMISTASWTSKAAHLSRVMNTAPTSYYLKILQRHRKSSFAAMVDKYAQMDLNLEKEARKKTVSLDEELKQMDKFFSGLSKKPAFKAGPDAQGAVDGHAQQEDKKIHQLWKDLGFSVEKSKNRPSLFEIKLQDRLGDKEGGQIKEKRKSLLYQLDEAEQLPPAIVKKQTKELKPLKSVSFNTTALKQSKNRRGSPEKEDDVICYANRIDRSLTSTGESEAHKSKLTVYKDKVRNFLTRKKSDLSPDSRSRLSKEIPMAELHDALASTTAEKSGYMESLSSRRVKWTDTSATSVDALQSYSETDVKLSKSLSKHGKQDRTCHIS